MSQDKAELRKIRERLRALDGAQWLMSADGETSFVEARGRDGTLVEIARFSRAAAPEEIDFFAAAPRMVEFLLGLVDRAIAASRNASVRAGRKQPAPEKSGKSKDYAAEAAMKCEDAAFRVYLEERHGLERPLTTERVASKLRSLLGITSRSELNNDAQTAERWRSLRADFEAWRRMGL